MYTPVACALLAVLSALEATAVPAPTVSPTVEGDPRVILNVPQWTSVQSLSDDPDKATWGGWGHGFIRGPAFAVWRFAFKDDYKAEKFTLETYKKEGDWIAVNDTMWDKQAEANPKVDKQLVVRMNRSTDTSPR